MPRNLSVIGLGWGLVAVFKSLQVILTTIQSSVSLS